MIRQELRPDLVTAEARYAGVLRELLTYAEHVDGHGDDDGSAHASMSARIRQMTGKDPDAFDLVCWWEAEGADVFAFRLALPDPPLAPLSSDDIRGVVALIKTPQVAELQGVRLRPVHLASAS